MENEKKHLKTCTPKGIPQMGSNNIEESAKTIRTNYEYIRTHRPRTILLTNAEYYRLFDKHDERFKTTPSVVVQKPPKAVIKPATVIVFCRAFKMDGHVCNAKVKKTGFEFCARHSKKST